MTDLTKLKELAIRATPGPWARSSVHQYDQTYITNDDDDDSVVIETASGISIENSRFITSANPVTILEMIEKIEDLEYKNKVYYSGLQKNIEILASKMATEMLRKKIENLEAKLEIAVEHIKNRKWTEYDTQEALSQIGDL